MGLKLGANVFQVTANPKKALNRLWVPILYLIISLLIFRKILSSPGTICYRNDWLLPQFPGQFKQLLGSFWYAWNPRVDLGFASTDRPELYYALLLYLTTLGNINNDVVIKLILILTTALAGYSMFYLCKRTKISLTSSLTSGIFYMMTPMVFDRFSGGHHSMVFGYALIPLSLSFFIKSLEEKGRGYKTLIVSGILTSLAVSHRSYIFVMLIMLLVCTIWVVYTRKPYKLSTGLRVLIVTLCILFTAHSFWIAPLIKDLLCGKISSLPFMTIETLPAELFMWKERHTEMINLVRLTGFALPYFSLVARGTAGYLSYMLHGLLSEHTINSIWIVVSFLLPILVFSAFLSKRKDRRTFFFGSLAIIGVTLSAGTKGPLGSTWLWLLKNISLSNIFRDPYKWIPLACLGYAGLLGMASEALQQLAPKFSRVKPVKAAYAILHRISKAKLTSPLLVFLLLNGVTFVYACPFLSGYFSGLQTYQFNEYKDIVKWLSSDPEDFRVLVLPAPSLIRHNELLGSGRDVIAQYAGKPSIHEGYLGSPRFVHFLIKTLYENRTKYLGKLLGLANVKYIVLDTNKVTTRYSPLTPLTTESLIGTLNQQEDVHLLKEVESVSIFNNTDYLPHIFPVSEAGLIVGDLSALISIDYVKDLRTEDVGLIFANQLSSDELTALSHLPNLKIVVQDDHFTDFTISLIPREYTLNVRKYATATSDSPQYEVAASPDRGWTALTWFYYDWYYTASLEDCVFTNARANLTIPFSVKQSGHHDIYLKLYFGHRSSKVNVYLDNLRVGQITTNASNEMGFRWIELGPFYLSQGHHDLTVESYEGENVLARVVVAPEDIVRNAVNMTSDLIRDKEIIVISEMERWQLPGGDGSWLPLNMGVEASQGVTLSTSHTQGASISKSLYVPKPGSYEVYLRASSDSLVSTLMVKIGDLKRAVSLHPLSKGFRLYKVADVNLPQGLSNVTIYSNGDRVHLDQLILQSTNSSAATPITLSHERINPCVYKVNVESPQSFCVIFSEAFAPYEPWRAHLNGEEMRAYPVYSFGNLFLVNQTGELTMTIKFPRHDLYEAGKVVAFGTLIILIAITLTPSRALKWATNLAQSLGRKWRKTPEKETKPIASKAILKEQKRVCCVNR